MSSPVWTSVGHMFCGAALCLGLLGMEKEPSLLGRRDRFFRLLNWETVCGNWSLAQRGLTPWLASCSLWPWESCRLYGEQESVLIPRKGQRWIEWKSTLLLRSTWPQLSPHWRLQEEKPLLVILKIGTTKLKVLWVTRNNFHRGLRWELGPPFIKPYQQVLGNQERAGVFTLGSWVLVPNPWLWPWHEILGELGDSQASIATHIRWG